MSPTIGTALAGLRRRLAEAGLPDPGLEARILLAGLLGLDATALVTGVDRPVTAADQAHIDEAASRRIAGMPVHRILGWRAFRDLDLHLSDGTLEPRPDTETLVDAVLGFAQERIARAGTARLLDLGTGTGAIALALLSACPGLQAVGIDISDDAVATALRNAEAHGLADRFEARQSDWFAAVDGVFDIIVSNPPYIATAELANLARDVIEHDPLAALDGGPDGLAAYRVIAAGAGSRLAKDGLVAVEIGHDQRESVSAVFTGAGFVRTGFARDYGGRDRVLLFARP